MSDQGGVSQTHAGLVGQTQKAALSLYAGFRSGIGFVSFAEN